MVDTSIRNVAAGKLYAVINNTNDPSIATRFARRRMEPFPLQGNRQAEPERRVRRRVPLQLRGGGQGRIRQDQRRHQRAWGRQRGRPPPGVPRREGVRRRLRQQGRRPQGDRDMGVRQEGGKRPVQRQQLVYSALQEQIAAGDIHAVNMRTYTPQEWQQLP